MTTQNDVVNLNPRERHSTPRKSLGSTTRSETQVQSIKLGEKLCILSVKF